MTDDLTDAEWKRSFEQNSSSSSVFIAVTVAIAAGIEIMSRDGITLGNALGTAVGAAGAYFVADALDLSVAEAATIGGLAGALGGLSGRAINGWSADPQTASQPSGYPQNLSGRPFGSSLGIDSILGPGF
ncbi:hypothetical protein [Pseudomonas sp. RIT-To-2]|uniref:hypothetical protein n=1 Tax=Pseudomonas sp. RIT-To-2 TaxID=3462541 RepID=UPI002413816A